MSRGGRCNAWVWGSQQEKIRGSKWHSQAKGMERFLVRVCPPVSITGSLPALGRGDGDP